MNKRLLLTSTTALLIAGACLSQTVPNGGFENWTDNGAGLEPNGWTTLNSFAGGGGTAPVERVSQAAAGTYAAKVTTVEIDPLGSFQGSSHWAIHYQVLSVCPLRSVQVRWLGNGNTRQLRMTKARLSFNFQSGTPLPTSGTRSAQELPSLQLR